MGVGQNVTIDIPNELLIFSSYTNSCSSDERTALLCQLLHGIMVVFVDLEDDVSDDPHADPNEPRGFPSLRKHHLGDKVTAKETDDGNFDERPNPNLNSLSAALGAYPYVRHALAFSISPTLSSYESQLTNIFTSASSPNSPTT